MRPLIVWISALLSISAFSADCTPVNLYDSQTSPFHRMPIYNQGELNTCYAYTASQLIDFYRFTKDQNATELTNPIWTALIHKINTPIHWNPDNLDFSRMTWVFDNLEDHGICKAEVMERAIDKLRNGNSNLTDEDILFFFQSLWDEFHNTKKIYHSREKTYQQAYDTVSKNEYFGGKIKTSLAEQFHFIVYRFEDKRLDALKNGVFGECKGMNLLPIELPPRKSSGFGFASNAKIQRHIEETLADSVPMGIGYCYNLVQNGPGFRGIKFKPRIIGMAFKNELCAAHYSMVVGKRPNAETGKCEYLIRNSFGTGFWTDKWNCTCRNSKKTKNEYFDCKASEAIKESLEVVGCWIDSGDLAENTFDLTRLR